MQLKIVGRNAYIYSRTDRVVIDVTKSAMYDRPSLRDTIHNVSEKIPRTELNLCSLKVGMRIEHY
jgi:hypothetical protein